MGGMSPAKRAISPGIGVTRPVGERAWLKGGGVVRGQNRVPTCMVDRTIFDLWLGGL